MGTLDCGLFSIAFAVELCVGRDPVRAFFDQKKMRQHLYECLLAGIIRPFPQTRQSTNQLSAVHPRTQRLCYELFCYCQMPEIYDNMGSVMTGLWVHNACAGLKDADLHEMFNNSWQCSECTG